MALILVSLFLITVNGLNTYIGDNDTYWRSDSVFIPESSGHYGSIRLRQHMIMSFDFVWYGRSEQTNQFEQILRLGWPAVSGGCSAQNSRYPSVWIDDKYDAFHISLSQLDNCGIGWTLSSHLLQRNQLYSIHIEFDDDFLFVTIDNSVVLDINRTSPTNPLLIGKRMNVFIASDHWNTPYAVVNASLSNIHIQSIASENLLTSTPSAATVCVHRDPQIVG